MLKLYRKHQTPVIVVSFALFMFAVFILAVAQELRTVTLAWLPNSETDLMGYTIYVKDVNQGESYDYGTPAFIIDITDQNDLNAKGFDPQNPGCQIGGLNPYSEYRFVARAYDTATDCKDAQGNLLPGGHCWSLDSNEVVLAALPEPEPLGPPTNIRKLSYNMTSWVIDTYRRAINHEYLIDEKYVEGCPGDYDERGWKLKEVQL